MHHIRAVVFVFFASVLIVACGSSGKESGNKSQVAPPRSPSNSAISGQMSTKSPSNGVLTRSELVTKANQMCYRLNARRATTTISRQQDFETLVPSLAAYESTVAEEMGQLKPPPSMAHDWQLIVGNAHAIAEITGSLHTYAQAATKSKAQVTVLQRSIQQMTSAAKRAGLKECSHFA